jgi:hypothetical protein
VTDSAFRRQAGRSVPELLAYLLVFVPTVALGSMSVATPLQGLLVASGGVVLSLALVAVGRGRLHSLAPLPTVVAAACVAITAAPGVVSESLAGATGLLLLFAVARRPGDARPISEVAPALSLPIVAVGLALACAVALPGIPGATGVAAALLVFVFLFLAWLYSRAELLAEGRPLTS